MVLRFSEAVLSMKACTRLRYHAELRDGGFRLLVKGVFRNQGYATMRNLKAVSRALRCGRKGTMLRPHRGNIGENKNINIINMNTNIN